MRKPNNHIKRATDGYLQDYIPMNGSNFSLSWMLPAYDRATAKRKPKKKKGK